MLRASEEEKGGCQNREKKPEKIAIQSFTFPRVSKVSSASKQPSGTVLQYVFLVVLAHSGVRRGAGWSVVGETKKDDGAGVKHFHHY